MSTQLQFIGSEQSWFETEVTGKSRGWRAGLIGEVSDGEAALLLATGKFRRSGAVPLNNPEQLTKAQVAAVQALVDGSGVDVAFTRAHDSLPQAYVLDAGGAGLLLPMRFTVNAPTDVIAAERIRTGGVNTFETTIAAASLTGEVIVAAVGAGVITSVHVGHSNGVSQTLATTNTASVNQLAKFSCLEVDDCNVVYVRFAPPRSSGRYCDVSVVGKRRS